jgi:hypothetical protein
MTTAIPKLKRLRKMKEEWERKNLDMQLLIKI